MRLRYPVSAVAVLLLLAAFRQPVQTWATSMTSSLKSTLGTLGHPQKASTTSPSLSMPISGSDQTAIRAVIEQQIQALQQDDAAGAFAFASPAIQAQFVTPQDFMAMVKSYYPAVYRPRSVMFEQVIIVDGMPTQQVLLMTAAGELVRANYLMEQQADRGWKINGCFLTPIEGQTI